MTDSPPREKLKVLSGGTVGPYLPIRVDQLAHVRAALDRHAVSYWVDSFSISLDGKPHVTVINFSRTVDTDEVQAIIDGDTTDSSFPIEVADEVPHTTNTRSIAEKIGAKVVGQVPNTGAGAFGAARLAEIVTRLQLRSSLNYVESPKVPMSEATLRKLAVFAERAGRTGRKVSPMQVAAQLIEDAVAALPEG